MGLFDPWDRTQIQKYRAIYAARLTPNIPPGLDRLFQGVIATRRLPGPAKYAWGALYATCVLVVPQWKGILTFALAGTAFAGYFPPGAAMVMGFVSLMTVGFFQSPIRSLPLVPGGRQERFLATVALILGLSTIWVLLFGVFIGLTHLLATLVPGRHGAGGHLTLHAISFKVLALPLAVVPFAALVQTLFYRKPAGLALAIMLVTTLMILSSTPLGLYQAITPALAVIGTALSWGICVSILYRIAMHRDLVRE